MEDISKVTEKNEIKYNKGQSARKGKGTVNEHIKVRQKGKGRSRNERLNKWKEKKTIKENKWRKEKLRKQRKNKSKER